MNVARPYLVLALAVGLAYLPTLFFGFTGHDDHKIVVELHPFLGDLHNVKELLGPNPFMSIGNGSFWRPMLGLSFMLDGQLWDQWLPGYHLTNLLLHLLAVSGVFVLLRELRYHQSLALFAALVVAVHPALAQSVAWLPGRNDSLLAVFVLFSLIALVRFMKRGRFSSALASIGCYVLALMTKETAVVLPALILILTKVMPKNRLTWQRKAVLWSGFLVTTALFLIIRAQVVSQPIEYASYLPQLPSYLLVDLPKIALVGLGKLLLISQLSPIMLLGHANGAWGFAALAAIGVLIARSHKVRPSHILLGFGWFVLFLVPTYPPHVPRWLDPLMDHRLWLPAVGLLIVLLESDHIKGWLLHARTARTHQALVVVGLAAVTLVYSQTFRNELSYAQRIVQIAPGHSAAQYILGINYYQRGMFEPAVDHLTQALAADPNLAEVNNHLGLIFLRQGKREEARAAFLRELQLNPNSVTARFYFETLSRK